MSLTTDAGTVVAAAGSAAATAGSAWNWIATDPTIRAMLVGTVAGLLVAILRAITGRIVLELRYRWRPRNAPLPAPSTVPERAELPDPGEPDRGAID